MAVKRTVFAIILMFLLSTSLGAQVVAPGKAPLKPKKPALTRTVETQLSGFTSQDADQLYARLSLQEEKLKQNWYIRGAMSRTVTKNITSNSHVITSKLDSRLEHITRPAAYTVWTGVLSRRDRNYPGAKRDRRSGYEFLSYGFGRQLSPKTKADMGVGLLRVWDEDEGTKPSVMLSVRGRHPLSRKFAFESDTIIIQPMDAVRSTKVDSDLALVHELAPGLSLRFGWSLNNLIRSVHMDREWDSILRLSISYRRTSTR